MTDTEREQAIAEAREEMQRAALLQQWTLAHEAQTRMRALIAGRSGVQAERMEREQGLA